MSFFFHNYLRGRMGGLMRFGLAALLILISSSDVMAVRPYEPSIVDMGRQGSPPPRVVCSSIEDAWMFINEAPWAPIRPVTKYRIYKESLASPGEFAPVTDRSPDRVLNFTSRGIGSADGVFAFKVSAVNADGESDMSEAHLLEPVSEACYDPGPIPGTPLNLTATPKCTDPQNATLSWLKPSRKAYTSDGKEVVITRYDIYRDGAKIGSVGGGVLSYTDTTIIPGVNHAYFVRAVIGSAESHYSNTAAASCPAPAFDFSISPIADATVQAGQSLNTLVNISLVAGVAEPVDLSIGAVTRGGVNAKNTPDGVSVSGSPFSSSSVTPSASSLLTLGTSGGTTPAWYDIEIKATAENGLTRSVVWRVNITSAAGGVPPLQVSCSGWPGEVFTGPGHDVWWNAAASGGQIPYTYSWSGSDSLSGTTAEIKKFYITLGSKTGTVDVRSSDAQSKSCNSSVSVRGEAPTGVSATAGTCAAGNPETVTVSWTKVGNTQVVAYKIFRDGVHIGSVGAERSSFADSTVLPATTYRYYVKASYVGGDSDPSPATGVYVTSSNVCSPSRVSAITGSTCGGKADVSWTAAPESFGGVSLSEYRIYYGAGAGNLSRGPVVPANRTSWPVLRLTPSQVYYFGVSAVYGSQESPIGGGGIASARASAACQLSCTVDRASVVTDQPVRYTSVLTGTGVTPYFYSWTENERSAGLPITSSRSSESITRTFATAGTYIVDGNWSDSTTPQPELAKDNCGTVVVFQKPEIKSAGIVPSPIVLKFIRQDQTMTGTGTLTVNITGTLTSDVTLKTEGPFDTPTALKTTSAPEIREFKVATTLKKETFTGSGSLKSSTTETSVTARHPGVTRKTYYYRVTASTPSGDLITSTTIPVPIELRPIAPVFEEF